MSYYSSRNDFEYGNDRQFFSDPNNQKSIELPLQLLHWDGLAVDGNGGTGDGGAGVFTLSFADEV